MAWAQAYPTRPITMVVPVPAGGQMDALSRVLAERMRNSLGQPVIIENISGADGSIGSGRVARSRPDGYTIELGNSSTHMLNGALYSLPYDVFKDFAYIAAGHESAWTFCKENDAGEGPERTHRLAESQSQ